MIDVLQSTRQFNEGYGPQPMRCPPPYPYPQPGIMEGSRVARNSASEESVSDSEADTPMTEIILRKSKRIVKRSIVDDLVGMWTLLPVHSSRYST